MAKGIFFTLAKLAEGIFFTLAKLAKVIFALGGSQIMHTRLAQHNQICYAFSAPCEDLCFIFINNLCEIKVMLINAGFEIVPIRVSETCQNLSGHVKCPCMVIRWTCPFFATCN